MAVRHDDTFGHGPEPWVASPIAGVAQTSDVHGQGACYLNQMGVDAIKQGPRRITEVDGQKDAGTVTVSLSRLVRGDELRLKAIHG